MLVCCDNPASVKLIIIKNIINGCARIILSFVMPNAFFIYKLIDLIIPYYFETCSIIFIVISVLSKRGNNI